MTTTPIAPPGRGSFALIDQATPGLASGLYKIAVTYDLKDVPAIPAQSYATESYVCVESPRFALDRNEIHAVFPPQNASGDFATTLPHIVLDRRSLPWARLLGAPCPAETPWLALLVFDLDELLPGDPDSPTRTTRTTAAALQADRTARVPRLADGGGDAACDTIAFASALFTTIVPGSAEVRYLAHVRQVNMEDQREQGVKADADGDGWFSIVVANRFPKPPADGTAPPRTTVVHLVSLEGFEPLLDGNAIPETNVRMVSLYSWSFTCTRMAGGNFTGLASGLVGGGELAGERILLRLDVDHPGAGASPAEAEIHKRLTAGYVPLDWRTPGGERTFAWYRGPFTPQQVPMAAKPEPFPSAAAAMVFDPAQGVFDQSLAVAWQTGRLLALADPVFAGQLVGLRWALFRKLDQIGASLLAAGGTVATQTADTLKALLSAQPTMTLMRTLAEGALKELLSTRLPTEPAVETATPWYRFGDAVARRSALPPAQFDVADTVVEALKSDEADRIEPVVAWLSRILLLKESPFACLVPEGDADDPGTVPRLLPRESLRFFHLDPNWQDALLDGALSIGSRSARDRDLDRMIRNLVWTALGATSGDPRQSHPKSGLLLRSELVSGWPGLSVRAMRRDSVLANLRWERIASDTLLCLFDGVPDAIHISEPGQGLPFGLGDQGRIAVRDIDPARFGEVTARSVAVPRRTADPSVININKDNGLVSQLTSALGRNISPAGVALQMFRLPGRLSLTIGT